MCGRYAFYSPSEATAALFGVTTAGADVQPAYNIAPTQQVAAVRRDEDDVPQLVSLRWGLVPFWAKDPSIGNRMINARAETVAEKPSFRNAYRKRRCLLLADGFYEWRKEAGGKTPYLISAADGQPFALLLCGKIGRTRRAANICRPPPSLRLPPMISCQGYITGCRCCCSRLLLAAGWMAMSTSSMRRMSLPDTAGLAGIARS